MAATSVGSGLTRRTYEGHVPDRGLEWLVSVPDALAG
jgi:hypothetical protein